MTADDSVFLYRLGEVERKATSLSGWRHEVDIERTSMKENVSHMRVELTEIHDDLRAMRRSLIGFAISVSVAAVGFSLSILAATGRI